MEHQFIRCTEKLPYVILQMDDPGQKNLLTIEGMRELVGILQHYHTQDSIRFIILTGSAEYFCFGGNLGNRFEQTSEDILVFSDLLVELHTTIKRSPKITLAAVNGKVGGGGLSLVDACDFALAAPEATFEFPEVYGGLAPMISIAGVAGILPSKQCMEMFAFGTPLTAQAALECRLVNRIVAAQHLLEEAITFLEPLEKINTNAYHLCKRYYHEIEGMDYSKQLELGKYFLVSMLKGI